MNEKEKIYEGKAKILYKGPEKNTAIQYFKDHESLEAAPERTQLLLDCATCHY